MDICLSNTLLPNVLYLLDNISRPFTQCIITIFHSQRTTKTILKSFLIYLFFQEPDPSNPLLSDPMDRVNDPYFQVVQVQFGLLIAIGFS